jgi:hypothetical protein
MVETFWSVFKCFNADILDYCNPLRTVPKSTDSVLKDKVICKVHTTTGHKRTNVEKMYSSTLSFTLALHGVDGQRHAPAAFTPGKDPVPIV